MKTTSWVEGYGVRGVRSLPWRKAFKTVDAMNAWAEKMDAEIIGTREMDAEEVRASARARHGLVGGMGKLLGESSGGTRN